MNNELTWNASQTRNVALTSIMSALIAFLTMTAIPVPPPVSAITLAPIVIFVSGILMGPKAGLAASAIGSAIGYIAGTSIGTISPLPGFLYVYLVGIVIARGPMGMAVGLLRRTNEIFAMTVGVVVETLIFFATDFYLFGIAYATFDFVTFIDLIFVPVTFVILFAVRTNLNVKYLA